MYLLIPGRHQLLTNFQFTYIQSIIDSLPGTVRDINGHSISIAEKITAVVFAVTSANHSHTRRNPLPFYLRAISIEAFGEHLPVPVYIYGIDDVGNVAQFADYTIKRIKHDSELRINLTPQNTLVVCSTIVMKMYQAAGYTILPAEVTDAQTWQYHEAMPWDLVEAIAANENWDNDPWITEKMHPASISVWRKYGYDAKVQLLFRDHMISSDGDLTDTRDYNVYVRQMDEIAEMKYKETARYIQPGRIGDIGCAVGSWIKLVSHDERFRESDIYGIEVSRQLYDICQQRKNNREFDNPFVFFAQRNAVTGLVFEKNSMNCIHTSSLTHEIASYGSIPDLQQFIANRYAELVPGGVWINRDVVGPFDQHKKVLMWLNKRDGMLSTETATIQDRHALQQHLAQLCTWSRFFRFVNDFRKAEGYTLNYNVITVNEEEYIELSLQDAAEFMSRKDYTDNWQSEMHETFCFWNYNEWQQQLQHAGFKIHPDSTVYTNEWIAENRWKNSVSLFEYSEGQLLPLEYPVTTMVLIGVKQ